jgi:hypothetical protein
MIWTLERVEDLANGWMRRKTAGHSILGLTTASQPDSFCSRTRQLFADRDKRYRGLEALDDLFIAV